MERGLARMVVVRRLPSPAAVKMLVVAVHKKNHLVVEIVPIVVEVVEEVVVPVVEEAAVHKVVPAETVAIVVVAAVVEVVAHKLNPSYSAAVVEVVVVIVAKAETRMILAKRKDFDLTGHFPPSSHLTNNCYIVVIGEGGVHKQHLPAASEEEQQVVRQS